MESDSSLNTPPEKVPVGNLAGFRDYFSRDALSGFLVFLIALPLCLGIAKASGYPPIAGIITAFIGGLICPLISNSELTIKGPAAGLIVIAFGCIESFRSAGYEPGEAYRLALAVGVVAGLIQIAFGLLRTGILSEIFPAAAVHGMLAAIGIIIASKQIHILLGNPVDSVKPFDLIGAIPESFRNMNPEIAVIGFASLLILFGLPLMKHRYFKRIPAPMLVLLVAIPLGIYFDLEHEHKYLFWDQEFSVGPKELVTLPASILSAFTLPDFSALTMPIAWKWIIMFTLVGSLESLLSSKAIDLLDPYQRRTNMNKDLLAVGVANTVAAMMGGLPMISEIVRSSANINNKAQTRFANFWHAMFLITFVALFPDLIHSIPLAALAAMLVYTGYRLASPKEWRNVYSIGREHLVVFITTVVMTLATDLLVGIASGIVMKFLIHLVYFAPVRTLFTGDVSIEEREDNTTVLRVYHAAVFSNWLSLRGKLNEAGKTRDVILDLSDTHLVDHTVMEKLHEMEREFENRQRKLTIIGLEAHQSLSKHPLATRRRSGNGNSINGKSGVNVTAT